MLALLAPIFNIAVMLIAFGGPIEDLGGPIEALGVPIEALWDANIYNIGDRSPRMGVP